MGHMGILKHWRVGTGSEWKNLSPQGNSGPGFVHRLILLFGSSGRARIPGSTWKWYPPTVLPLTNSDFLYSSVQVSEGRYLVLLAFLMDYSLILTFFVLKSWGFFLDTHGLFPHTPLEFRLTKGCNKSPDFCDVFPVGIRRSSRRIAISKEIETCFQMFPGGCR